VANIRPRKRQRSTPKQQEEVQSRSQRAQNVIVQHVNAGEMLNALREELDRSDKEDAALDGRSTDLIIRNPTSVELMSLRVGPIADFERSLAHVRNPADRQAVMIQRSLQLVKDLLEGWTNVLDSDERPPEVMERAARPITLCAIHRRLIEPAPHQAEGTRCQFGRPRWSK
jgi:hypothetical protein